MQLSFCMYVCLCLHVSLCLFTSVSVCICVCVVPVCLSVHRYKCSSLSACMCSCVFVCLYVCVSVDLHLCCDCAFICLDSSTTSGTPNCGKYMYLCLFSQGTAIFDFSDTGYEVHGNCNAPRAVTLSGLIYCLRSMVGHDIPLNQVTVHPGHLTVHYTTAINNNILYSSQWEIKAVIRSHNEEHISVIVSH